MTKKTFRLPEPFFTKWKEVLRSGKYKQAEGTLVQVPAYDEHYDDECNEEPFVITEEHDKSYCCLGVACDMEGVDVNLMVGNDLPSDLFQGMRDAPIPQELIGRVAYPGNELPDILAALNDGLSLSNYKRFREEHPDLVFKKVPEYVGDNVSYTFEDIADWLDDNVEGYEPIKEEENGEN